MASQTDDWTLRIAAQFCRSDANARLDRGLELFAREGGLSASPDFLKAGAMFAVADALEQRLKGNGDS